MPSANAPDPAVARWIRRMLTPAPRARSLVVTVWGDLLAPHGGEVWVSTLIRLLASLGCNERLVRTSVFRLARDGWLAAMPVGRRTRYRLTAAGAHRFSQAYRRIYSPPYAAWDGRWDVVIVPDTLPPAKRRSLRDELAWEGFGALGAGVHARPSRGEGGLGVVALAHPDRGRLTAFEGRDLEASPAGTLAGRVEEAYALGALAAEYRRFLARFGGVADAFRRAERHDPEQAFVVRSLLVHEYRRVRLRDPQLPRALLPPEWPGDVAYALCRQLYRLVQPASESHLSAMVDAEGETLLPSLPEFLLRFAEP